MKAKAIAPKALSCPPLFGAVSSVKRRKKIFLLVPYGTSSKPATNNLPSKLSIFNFRNNSNSILPVIWKSVAVASSLLTSITSNFRKNKTEDGESNIKSTDDQKSTQAAITSHKLNSDDLNATDGSLNTEIKHSPLIQKIEENTVEQSFFEWLAGGDLSTKRKEFLNKDEKKVEKSTKSFISKSSLQQRSRFLVSSLSEASSSASRLLRLEEVCKHLLLYPEQKAIMCKAGLLKTTLLLKNDSSDKAIQEQAKCVLALVGYHDPPKGDGIRILSIDGGGTRGIMAIEILRQLEAKTNKKVYELFDFICGVSSGAILSLLLGGLRVSLDECEYLYRKLSDEIFCRSAIWGTSRLMWSHAYYDTTAWVNVLKKTFGETLMIDTAKDKDTPKLAVVSAIMNLPHLQAFVFRNYDFPPRIQSYYRGSCRYRMWESIRASGAAPGYFEEYCLDDYLHQDGGVLINNPAALAIHEAQLLWPSDSIQCVMSLGSGRYVPAVSPSLTSTSLKTKILKIIDSATDTEAVHITVNDLLTPDTYFRLNPYLTEFLTLDENRKEKLDQMKVDAQMYLRRNEYKFSSAAQTLLRKRSVFKHSRDWLRAQKAVIF
ncbi:Calcium-independent phospholipase A2-gamma like protein [Argiope bruennichi]|uniref:Calcium-independent phospholipase A2-gamma like protein n=1 Tax=Argiope bruennichi TaxID=94029 RepID=A0A8T0EGU5_ARGBR|nr:Calcium-independent phospholipase A2-gamma like protein [Argiope bruennichi]